MTQMFYGFHRNLSAGSPSCESNIPCMRSLMHMQAFDTRKTKGLACSCREEKNRGVGEEEDEAETAAANKTQAQCSVCCHTMTIGLFCLHRALFKFG